MADPLVNLANSLTDVQLDADLSQIDDEATHRALSEIHDAINILLETLGFDAGDTTNRLLLLEATMATFFAIVEVSTNYIIKASDGTILINASSNSVTTTLPAASTLIGKEYDVKLVAQGFPAKLATAGAELIDDSSLDFTLSLHESVTVKSDGVKWWII